ncbi:cytochrome P450 family protein [Pseudonocardia spinosispora]|uniref:cytochrome P450 family protein n=1 Tax=Pseudonocardia spinosispora TaxID=103441 RepID=UPI00040DE026|nr:cytochrome P450 [Pseudonocardia spinosispora]
MQRSERVRLGREFVQNPHELYRELRSDAPVSPALAWGGVPVWLVTGYDEARQLLGDPRLGKDFHRVIGLFPPELAGAHSTPMSEHMLSADPPDHTRLRRLVSKAFTAHTVTRLRPAIERIADDLLDAMSGDAAVDLIEAYALPLPIRVIGAMLGVPSADHPRLRDWIDPLLVDQADPTKYVEAQTELAVYLVELIADKRGRPDEDLISMLIRATDQGDQLTETELINMIFLLIVAGYETTVNLIGNGVFALLNDPTRLDQLRTEPTLLPDAVEELLRFDSPLNTATNRYTTVPVTIGNVTIPANRLVLISLLAANHDDTRFPDPHTVDPRRPSNPHLAFGHGIHYCLGAPLARLEGRIALGRLIERFPGLTLDPAAPSPVYRNSTLIRGLVTLPVRLSRSRVSTGPGLSPGNVTLAARNRHEPAS